MAILASACSVFCGSTPFVSQAITIDEPGCGWDTAEVSWFMSEADGDIDVQITANQFLRTKKYVTDLDPLSAMYITDLRKEKVDGGWIVSLSIRGAAHDVPISGLYKFYRLPYAADMEFITTGGEDVTVTSGGTTLNPASETIRFTEPGLSFQDCYMANGTAFSPDFASTASRSNLANLGWGTNYDLSVLAPLTDFRGAASQTPAAHSFGEQFPIVRPDMVGTPTTGRQVQKNYNSGWMVTQRSAERVVADTTVDLWLITDSFVHYNRRQFV
jgi:hypothetical protein